jgi:hypothetical protein
MMHALSIKEQCSSDVRSSCAASEGPAVTLQPCCLPSCCLGILAQCTALEKVLETSSCLPSCNQTTDSATRELRTTDSGDVARLRRIDAGFVSKILGASKLCAYLQGNQNF